MTRDRRGAATVWILALGLGLFLRPGGEVTAKPDRASQDLDLARAVSRARSAVAARVRPAIVSLRCVKAPVVEEGVEKTSSAEGYGAGILVRSDGMILTAHHVIEGARAVKVRLWDDREYTAYLHASDPAIDIALLKIRAKDLDLPVATLARSRPVELGETVLAFGNPFGLAGSVSTGILSGRDRRGVVAGNTAPLLQTDAAVNPGSSGGALVNLEGEVVGLVNAILTRSGGDQGVAFAVPSMELRFALKDLLAGREVERGWVGVHVNTRSDGKEGIEVLTVVPRGPAARAGIAPGDRILRWNRRRLKKLADLRRVVRTSRVGDEVTVEFLRGDKRRTSSLTVAKKQ